MYRITMLGAVTALLLLLVAPPGALAVPTSDPDEIAKSESPDSSTAYHPVGMHICRVNLTGSACCRITACPLCVCTVCPTH